MTNYCHLHPTQEADSCQPCIEMTAQYVEKNFGKEAPRCGACTRYRKLLGEVASIIDAGLLREDAGLTVAGQLTIMELKERLEPFRRTQEGKATV